MGTLDIKIDVNQLKRMHPDVVDAMRHRLLDQIDSNIMMQMLYDDRTNLNHDTYSYATMKKRMYGDFKMEYMQRPYKYRDDQPRQDTPQEFWAKHYLIKHEADEVDEFGQPIIVYSIVEASAWDSGIKVIPITGHESWASNYLPKDLFEEVASNWYELMGEEADLEEYVRKSIRSK